jgi:hypothetical protein
MAEAPNWQAIREMSPVVDAMMKSGTPLTRENYIRANYGEPGDDGYPEQWTAEHEAELPEPFQRG